MISIKIIAKESKFRATAKIILNSNETDSQFNVRPEAQKTNQKSAFG